MKTAEIGYLILLFLSTLEMTLLVVYGNPVSEGVFLALLGQFIVIEGAFGIGLYCHMYKKRPAFINRSPTFITGLLSILGGFVTVAVLGSPDIGISPDIVNFPKLELVLANGELLKLGYDYWLAACSWVIILIGLLMVIFDYDTTPISHIPKTIKTKRNY
ncbi:MAG: hypothetical protein ACFFD4_35980 [Candidatus Odinarchaeota archaeon]